MREGDVVAARFLLLSERSSGGMGTIYRARDLSSGGPVALKVQNAGDDARFAREAETLARLEHPAIVRGIASGPSWLAMEWLEGEDLAARLRRGKLSLGDAVTLGKRVAAGLAAAHAQGIVHRDLKPANVFLPGGEVSRAKLLDFGVARRPDTRTREKTAEGVVLGTVGYMAPEQARGELRIGAAADLFSLGVVLFEAISGTPPFSGAHAVAVLGKVLVEETPRLSQVGARVPRALDDLVRSLLAKSPDDRPRSAELVLSILEAIDLEADLVAPAPRGLGTGEQKLSCLVLISPTACSGDEQEDGARVRRELAEVAARHGSHLEPMLGGTMLVTLESEGSIREQAARAARCALELRDTSPGDLVVLATGRRSTTMPMGEVVDRGVALLRELRGSDDDGPPPVSAGARVRLDELTADLLREEFELGHDDRGSFLDAVRPRSGARNPLYGRARELGFIESTLEQCFEESSARAIVIVGPPGIGKSRLALEALSSARDATVWSAGADPVCEGAPFSVLGRALARAIGGTDDDAIRTFLAEQRLPVGLEAGLSLLFGHAPVDHPQHGTRASVIRDALEQLMEQLLARRPLLLLLEDVQWADLPTLRLVDGLLRRFSAQPLLVLSTARPEIAELHPRLWAQRNAAELRLLPLSRAASERVVKSRVAGADDATVDAILARARGNPLFLHELARATEEGRAATEGGTRLGDRSPATVVSVIEARLRALAPDLRRVLRAASVFGAFFPRDGVLALLGPSARDEELEGPLRTLLDQELLVRDAGAWGFAHGLFAEAAYAMLTDEDRALGHRLAAEHLSQQGESAMTVAHHHERAGDRERATELYLQAAEEALDGGDHEAAILRADRGVACGAEGEPRGMLDAVAGEAHQRKGELDRAAERGRRALERLSMRSPYWSRAQRAAVALGISRIRF